MRIAQVGVTQLPDAPWYERAECLVLPLAEELARRGHAVTLFSDSQLAVSDGVTLVTPDASADAGTGATAALVGWSQVMNLLSQRLDQLDVIHSHLDHWGFPLARLAPCPVVTTLHGRLDLPELQPLYARFADVPLVAVSDAQRRAMPHARWVATVHPGLDLEQYQFGEQSGSYLAFLGDPELLDLDMAIRVARRAGCPLRVAFRPGAGSAPGQATRGAGRFRGRWSAAARAEGVQVVELVEDGAVGPFLAGAAGLLYPARAAETFGLAMIEALACGTPVLALDRGSAPELIRHGVTGFLCRAEEELTEAVLGIVYLNRAACRAEAEERFSLAAMATRYERVYQQLFGAGRADAAGSQYASSPADGETGPAAGDHCLLTVRQREVARLVAQGHTNRQISRELVLSEKTVANYLQDIFRRLGASSRTQVAVWAIEHGLLGESTGGEHRCPPSSHRPAAA